MSKLPPSSSSLPTAQPQQQGRKMRRSRVDAASSSSSNTATSAATNTNNNPNNNPNNINNNLTLLSGFELYTAQGNAAAALNALYGDTNNKSNNNDNGETMASQYNRLILSHLAAPRSSSTASPAAGASAKVLLNQLESFTLQNNNKSMMESSSSSSSLTARKRKRNEFIMAYNQALLLFTTGQYQASARLAAKHLKPIMSSSTTTATATATTSTPTTVKPTPTNLPLEIAKVASRMAMTWLEALLAMGGTTTTFEDDDVMTPDAILQWLEALGLEHKSAEFKFLLSLYRGRVDLMLRTPDATHQEAHIRSARKELKIAMEVFQHKLRTTTNNNDTVSVVSSVDSQKEQQQQQQQQQTTTQNKDNTSHHSNINTINNTIIPEQLQQLPSYMAPTQQSIVLQKLHQSALNLKASLEQLKGNIKKSLILCQEAHFDTASLYYNSIHSNNLAVVYQTSHKRHLALHVLSKALQQPDAGGTVASDGTAAPSLSFYIVWNAALCALQARNYKASYECFLTCLLQSSQFQTPQTWLRLAEACLGLHHKQTGEDSAEPYYYRATPIQVHGQITGLVIHQPQPEDTSISGLPRLGSDEDLELVMRHPLKRARFALEYVLNNFETDKATGQSARLALAYVLLCSRDFERTLELAQAVLDAEQQRSTVPSNKKLTFLERVRVRRCATARMYAAEAYCCMGDAVQAMKCLVGPYGQDANTLDRLAYDLGGVTIEMAAVSSKGKRRLARAQTIVRASTSAVTAAMGNIKAAKQLAMSAQAMEDAMNNTNSPDCCGGVVTRSLARRALVYCLLRERNSSAALSLLQSSSSPWAMAGGGNSNNNNKK